MNIIIVMEGDINMNYFNSNWLNILFAKVLEILPFKYRYYLGSYIINGKYPLNAGICVVKTNLADKNEDRRYHYELS